MSNNTKRTLSILSSLLIVSSLNSCKKEEMDKVIENITTSNYSDITTTKLVEEVLDEIIEKEKTTIEEITSKKVNTTKNYITTEKNTESDTKYQIDDEYVPLIKCSDDNYTIPSELSKKIDKTIKNFSKDDVSFLVYDINSATTFSYNLNETFNGACIVKPSVVLYLLKLAENGIIDLNDTIAYPGSNVSGSGYLNGYYDGTVTPKGTEISILEYMYHTLYYSDNNAYKVLYDVLINSEYYDDYVQFMNSIDAKSLCVDKDKIWVREATATAGVNVMLAIDEFKTESNNTFNIDYEFLDGNNLKNIVNKDDLTYGEILYWMMADGKYDYIEEKTGNFSVTKTGFVSGSGSLSCRNLISISYPDDSDPYVICLLTKFNSQDSRKSTVKSLLGSLDDTVTNYQKSNSKRLIKY